MKGQGHSCLIYNGMQAVFDADEVVSEIRGIYSQGIELLGFKPLSELQDYYNVGAVSSSFLNIIANIA